MTRRRHQRLTDVARAHAPYIPVPWSVEQFVTNVATSRRRSITLLPWPLRGGGLTGCYLPTAHADYIFFDDAATGRGRDAIITHEISHIVLAHDPHLGVTDADILAAIAPTASVGASLHFLARAGYDSGPEHDAETLGTLLLVMATARRPPDSSTELGRLTDRLR